MLHFVNIRMCISYEIMYPTFVSSVCCRPQTFGPVSKAEARHKEE